MLTFIYLLIGVTISGGVEPIYAFPDQIECEMAVGYIQSLSETPANVFCTEVFLEVV